jgi:hypothetical protein
MVNFIDNTLCQFKVFDISITNILWLRMISFILHIVDLDLSYLKLGFQKYLLGEHIGNLLLWKPSLSLWKGNSICKM